MRRPPPRLRTERRRLVQPLWSALDEHLRPALSDGVLLAVSGGPDSRALLEAAARWIHRDEGVMVVGAIDHGTRAASALEAEAVVARARALGFVAARLVVTPASHDEAALRDARYRALAALARREGALSLVTAHHAGDVAEGALMSWLGSGGGGVAMPQHGGREGLQLVRPFLRLRRDQLRLALAALVATDTFADPDARSLRARVRREQLEPLGGDRGAVEEALALNARRRREDEEVLLAQASALIVVQRDHTLVRVGPPALLRRALKLALSRMTPGDDVRRASTAVEKVVQLMQRGAKGEVHLPGATATILREGARLGPDPPPPLPVAEERAPTHDGKSGKKERLSVVETLPTVPPVPGPGDEET